MVTTIFAVNKNGEEICSNYDIHRVYNEYWSALTEKEYTTWSYEEAGDPDDVIVFLPKGTIKKITGVDLTWNDEPLKCIEL